ncbi:hypothetical protein QL285_008784 [Trifolium repens]|nr:hypothetical protein QL285_008784 [Trifolium repens]
MSQSSHQTSPTKTSPQKSSPSKPTTTVPNITEQVSDPLPQSSYVITDATPLTMIHPSFDSILNPTPSNPPSSPKSKTKKRTKSTTTRKSKPQKSKSRYSLDFNMQELYLSNLGNTNPNAAYDVAAPVSSTLIEENKEESTQTLSPKKGESTVMGEHDVPNTSSNKENDDDAQNIQIAQDALNSLGESSSEANVVPDASASLAQDQPQDTDTDVVDDPNVQQKEKAAHMADDGVNNPDNVVADDAPHQMETATGEIHSDNAMSENLVHVNAEDDIEGDSTEDDVTIMKIVGDSRKKAGKTGVGRRLRERKETVTEVMAEEPKSTKKKKNVAVEATTPSKKKKVASEATTSTKKKKMYGPLRRSSRVEIPSKQKKQGSKRKTINLSDSNSDAEENAPPISTASKQKTPKKRKTAATAEDAEVNAPGIVSTQKKKAGRSIPQNVPDVPMDNVSFHFPTSVAKWKFVYHRRLAVERELAEDTMECTEVMELINQAGLLKTVCGLGKCYEKLVKEFTVNIGEDCASRLSKEFHQVFVRGKCINFSPAVINSYLGRKEDGYPGFEPTNNQICKTITANQVKVWPLKGKVPSAMLSVKYAILNRIGASNWVPTTHSSTIATSLAKFIYAIGTGADVDYGSLIFDQIVEHGKSWAMKLVISFPTIICGIILNQHPNILHPEDLPCKRESPLTLSYKLFDGKHAADIIVPPKKVVAQENVASTSMNRKAMITTLEATVRALDEQKSELQRVISALKKEEAEEEGLMEENEGDDAAVNDVDAAVGDAADEDVDEEGGDTEELEVSDSSASL